MLRTRCPAKINLFLSVGPKDASGYHPIRTTMAAFDLCDELTVSLGDGRFTCNWPDLPAENTVTRTLRLLADIARLPALDIDLVKRIPDRGGFGGGSSDAAGVLRCVAALFPRAVSTAASLEVARAVGADVPFFLIGGLARAEGYGEALTPLDDAPEMWVTAIMPNARCDTSAAYARLDELPRSLKPFPADGGLFNDFEAVAPPECAAAMRALRNLGAGRVGMTGSGAAVFAICHSSQEAERFRDGITQSSQAVAGAWTARTLPRSECLRVDRVR